MSIHPKLRRRLAEVPISWLGNVGARRVGVLRRSRPSDAKGTESGSNRTNNWNGLKSKVLWQVDDVTAGAAWLMWPCWSAAGVVDTRFDKSVWERRAVPVRVERLEIDERWHVKRTNQKMKKWIDYQHRLAVTQQLQRHYKHTHTQRYVTNSVYHWQVMPPTLNNQEPFTLFYGSLTSASALMVNQHCQHHLSTLVDGTFSVRIE